MQILWAQAVAQRGSNCCDNVRASERERERQSEKNVTASTNNIQEGQNDDKINASN